MPKTQGQRFQQAIKKYKKGKETRAQRERVLRQVNAWLKNRYAHSQSIKIKDYDAQKWAIEHAPFYTSNKKFLAYFDTAQEGWREVGAKLRRYKNHYNQQHGGGSYRGTSNHYHDQNYDLVPRATRAYSNQPFLKRRL